MIPGSFSTFPYPGKILLQLLTPPERAVYQYFCICADNQTGEWWAWNRQIARQTGYAISTVKNAKTSLRRLGLIRVHPAPVRANGSSGPSTVVVVDIPNQHYLWAINPDWDPDDWDNPVPDPRKGDPDYDGTGVMIAESGLQRTFMRMILSRIATSGKDGESIEPCKPEGVLRALRRATARREGKEKTIVQEVAAELRSKR